MKSMNRSRFRGLSDDGDLLLSDLAIVDRIRVANRRREGGGAEGRGVQGGWANRWE